MLSINGLHNFYYLPELHDMRCKAQRICEIIRGRYHRDPLNGDVYMFMSKDQRKVRMIHYERNAYYLHEKSFIKGYKFMKIERKDEKPYRKGMRYNKDCVGTPIIHKSDYTMVTQTNYNTSNLNDLFIIYDQKLTFCSFIDLNQQKNKRKI